MDNLDASILEPCDIIFTFNKKSFVSKLIWKLSLRGLLKPPKEKISHAVLYMDQGLIFETDFFGASIKNWRKYMTPKYQVYLGRIDQPFDKNIVIEAAKEMAGIKTYAFKQIFSLLFNKIFQIKENTDVDAGVTCSESVADCFKKAGIDFMPGSIDAVISPIDMYNSPILTKIKLIG